MTQPPPPPPGTPPPPPPGTPPPGSGWGQAPAAGSFRVGEAISYGWTVYWQNAGPMIVLALVIFGVNMAIGLAGSNFDNATSQVLLNIISFLIGIILAMGLIRASLAVVSGGTPAVAMLFLTEGFGAYFLASILVGIGVVLGMIALIVPGIILAIMWHFFGYVIVEDPSTGALDAMRRSAEITRGHRWQLLGLGFALLGLNILGLLLCIVPIIFTYGITAITVAYTYRHLTGQAVVQP